MSKQPYAHLKDGTPVIGIYDIDGTPMLVEATWHGRRISTDGEVYLALDCGEGAGVEGDIGIDEWQDIKALAHTTVVEELLDQARAFLVSGPGPIEQPDYITGHELEARWHAMSREEQLDERKHARLDPSIVPPAALLAMPEVLAKWRLLPRVNKQKAVRIIRVIDNLSAATQQLTDDLNQIG